MTTESRTTSTESNRRTEACASTRADTGCYDKQNTKTGPPGQQCMQNYI